MALIEREALKRRIENYRRDCEEAGDTVAAQVFADCITELEDAPTIDPVHAAGGCYCRECLAYEGHICKNTGFYKSEKGWCDDGVPREARAMADWTSVKDALPKPGVEVLCCYINPHRRDKPPRMMVGRDPCGLTGRANIYFWCGGWRAVTHWMELPRPPKRDTK